MSHHCHAIGCKTPCPPRMLMCARHWRLVPTRQQVEVYKTFRPGQCEDKRISPEWRDAAVAAIEAVARYEGRVEEFNQWRAQTQALKAKVMDAIEGAKNV